MPYQSFPQEEKGNSDSPSKFKALGLPENLTGARVLDLGCNEGFFCMEVKRRGASRVLGIDIDPKAIEKARSRASDIEFRCQSWDTGLPQEEFDYVLLMSSLHYARDKQRLLDDIHSILAPQGKLILECGVVPSKSAMWVKTWRSSGEAYHPTAKLLEESLLKNYAFRCVHWSVPQSGDPVPRKVYHCSRYKPIALLIAGGPLIGKSTFARQLQRGECSHFLLDDFVHLLVKHSDGSQELTRFLDDRLERGIQVVIDELVTTSLVSEFTSNVIEALPHHHDMLVLEGYGLQMPILRRPIVHALKERGYVVWNASRLLGFDTHCDYSMLTPGTHDSLSSHRRPPTHRCEKC